MRSILVSVCLLSATAAFIIDPVLHRSKRDCPMSPYALFLTTEQQQTLHELIVEARQSGASEDDVKQHMNRYIGEVLPPSRFAEFKRENDKFEKNRAIFVRGKRSVENGLRSKQLPQRVFDLVDYYSTSAGEESALTRFYEESSVAKIMRRPLA
ncbi:hypothetical protein PFISCL1PPCAC_2828 [Pristionchus fissidentatus]|uniref:Uncharacterized protein n=1 Tax=Pristionchus fissidentatus TaxID=1538716 RepID=A0AAV5UWU6_9BILA|nr:hypothetical protein PFISCL1PPCAC_2828 [Pristionchus fissidentatus]